MTVVHFGVGSRQNAVETAPMTMWRRKRPFRKPLWALSVDFSDQRILGQLNILGSNGYARC
jgi:hypothetical protein